MGWFFIIIILIFIILRFFLIIFIVEQGSMRPTFNEGDQILAIRHWPQKWLKRNQIIIIKSTKEFPKFFAKDSQVPFQTSVQHNSDSVKYIIKRVTGLPGDSIIVNLKDLEKTKHKFFYPYFDKKGQKIWNLGKDEIFAIGENKYSYDSRDWGPINIHYFYALVIKKF